MRDVSLYIHIPFCKSKCYYCDFLSFPGCTVSEHKRYVEALIEEIKAYSDVAIRNDYIVKTIFIGGGTPSILDGAYIRQIVETIYSVFVVSMDVEFTIEGNPDSLCTDKLKLYKEIGINRLSIGLQSAVDDELKIIGRPHNYDQFVAAYNSARQCKFHNINIDIMSDLPTQTFKSYGSTLARVLSFAPEHISAYSLILEENTPFFYDEEIKRLIPDEEIDRKMYAQTKKLLSISGYNRYEISNYSKTGYECRHNLTYWSGGDYIGVGLGSSGYIEGYRYSNISDMREYIEANPKDKICDRHILSRKDMIEEYMFLGLRKIKGISVEEFSSRFEENIYGLYGDVISKYIDMELLIIDKDNLRFTDKGLDICNQVLSDFLLD